MDVYYTKGNNVKVNLTKMFGEGNEPTPEEFESMFPKPYYTYEEGTCVNIIKLILLKKKV